MTIPVVGRSSAVQAILTQTAPVIILVTVEVKDAAVAYIYDILDRAACVPPK